MWELVKDLLMVSLGMGISIVLMCLVTVGKEADRLLELFNKIIGAQTKSASVYARIDPVLKEQAEMILSALGIPTSNAIDMFFKQIVLKKGLPFEVRLPYEKPVCIGALSEEEMNAEIEKGYADIQAGRTKPLEQAIAEMRRDFKI